MSLDAKQIRMRRQARNLVKAPFDLISILSDRMLGKIVLDAIVFITGPRGTGKSETSLYIAERLAIKNSKRTGLPKEYYFTIDNVRTVDKKGTLKMLGSTQLIEHSNQIFIVDNANIAANAKDFFSEENKRLGGIVDVARIYRHCIIFNMVSTKLLDSVIRQFADIAIATEKGGIDSVTGINKVKVYVLDPPAITSKNRDMRHKYFQFENKDKRTCRITRMLVKQPSEETVTGYNELRLTMSNRFVLDEFGQTELKEGEAIKRNIQGSAKLQEAYRTHGETVMSIYNQHKGKNCIRKIQRETGLTDYWINKIIAHNIQEKK